MNRISKSIYVLMFVDTLIYLFSTFFVASYYNVPEKFVVLSVFLFSLLGIYVLSLKGYYSIRKYDFYLKDAYLLFEGVLLAAIIPYILLLFLDFDKSILEFFVTDIALVYILIVCWRAGFYCYRRYLKHATNILIIGVNKGGKLIAKEILAKPMLKLNIIGFIDNAEDRQAVEFEGIKVIGKTSNLKQIIEENNIKTIVIALKKVDNHQILMDISECVPQGVDIWKMPDYYECITQKIPVLVLTPEWFLYDFTRLEKPLYDFLKRIMDILASIIILGLTFPVLLFIGIVVKFYDGGAVIYTQERVGKNGVPFKMYKLRTMCEGADKAGMVDKGNTADDRVIPFCRWVRKARFDEIPQMVNILKGDMSIVGPRAEFVDFVKKYEKEIPFYNRRHWVVPGWTGWAQINQGHCVSVDDITEKLRYDFFYIKNRNIFWDISILMRAIGMALFGRHR